MPSINNVAVPYAQSSGATERRQSLSEPDSSNTVNVQQAGSSDSSTLNTANEQLASRPVTPGALVEGSENVRDDVTVQAFETQLQNLTISRSLQSQSDNAPVSTNRLEESEPVTQPDANSVQQKSEDLRTGQQSPDEGLGLIVNTHS